MWKDILLSVVMSISESIGTRFVEKKNKEKLLKQLEGEINIQFNEFADTSLDCNEFYSLVQNRKFIEVIRNFFLAINDGMDRSQYSERIEQYIYNECKDVNHVEVRKFIKKIEELYEQYLHKIIEDYPEIYALFQLMTISHREIIARILDNEENLKKYFDAFEYKKVKIDDDNIKLYHRVSEKEYGIIRFTGISGAERKKEQYINDFYVENSFSYYGKETEKLFQYGLDNIETIRLENFFDFGNKIVLIGGAGFGKSTSLNYLFCNYEKIYGVYALKIKIDLKEYAKDIGEKKKDILWCIATEFFKRIKHTNLTHDDIQTVLSGYLDKGKCLVILDALDEIPTLPIRNKVRDEIANFCEIYYLNKFIISTREAGYLRNKFDDTFLHIKINQFNMKQIKKYSNNWYNSYYEEPEDFEDFWTKFSQEIRRARCENIISNPIILILALVIFDIEKNLPTRRIEFYQKCIETFLTEREDRKAAYVLDEKTKSILAMNLTVPKIAHYKFKHLEKNIGYKFNNSELEKSVFDAIGVKDTLNWSAAVKQYVEYLVERTELVREVDENIYDFAHKTFYEYFLAFYFCKMYNNNELVNILDTWIGDSNYDELARLIIEEIIQNNDPRQHDYIMNYLFERLNLLKKDEESNNKIDIFLIIVDLYNHNMIQPKFYENYNKFILYNSRFVDRVKSGIYLRNIYANQRVQYDAKSIAELFKSSYVNNENMLNIIDTFLYLNKDYRRQVIEIMKKEEREDIEHIGLLFDCTKEMNEQKVEGIRNSVTKVNMCKQEINYFLNVKVQYLNNYPQIFLSVISLSIILDMNIKVEKFINYTFELNTKFFAYTNLEVLLKFAHKSSKSQEYFLLFFITIVRCANKKVNTIFEYILEERYYNRSNISIANGDREIFYSIWKYLNEAKEYEEFLEGLIKLNLYNKKYDHQYKEAYILYLQNNKGRNDDKIKRLFVKTKKKKD